MIIDSESIPLSAVATGDAFRVPGNEAFWIKLEAGGGVSVAPTPPDNIPCGNVATGGLTTMAASTQVIVYENASFNPNT